MIIGNRWAHWLNYWFEGHQLESSNKLMILNHKEDWFRQWWIDRDKICKGFSKNKSRHLCGADIHVILYMYNPGNTKKY